MSFIKKLMCWLLPAEPAKLDAFWGKGAPPAPPPGAACGDAPISPPPNVAVCDDPDCARCARRKIFRALYTPHPN